MTMPLWPRGLECEVSGSQHTCAPLTVHCSCPWLSTGHQCQDPPQVPKSMDAQGPPRPRTLHPQIHQPRIINGVPDAVVCCVVTRSSLTLVAPWTTPARLLCPWDFPGKNTGVGCHFWLQGIFPIQGRNMSLLLGRQILYHSATLEIYGAWLV